jgi:dolichyl-phosphate beta-glucosyltransferase
MLSVVIPCYNEAERLGPMLDLVRANADLGWQWIFVDDGSRDATSAAVETLATNAALDVILVRHERNRGKGAAVRSGFLRADRELVGYVDADLAASPLEFLPFLAGDRLRAGRELLLGIRLLTEEKRVERTFFRHLIGRIYQTYVSNLTGLTVYDTQCGFKLLATDQARAIAEHMNCDGFAFDVELILLARDRFGMAIREEPIHWREQGDSRVLPHHAARMFWEILRIRRRLNKRCMEEENGKTP